MTLERWKNFTRRDQLGHIAAEIKRALLANQSDDVKLLRSILERAFELIDLSLEDAKWKDNPLLLLRLRQELSRVYIGEVQSLDFISSSL